MLLEFSVGNFRSFYEPVTLSMQAAKLRASDRRLDQENIAQVQSQRLLRSAAIYGANASGKSNLIRAIQFMRDFVLHSSKESQAKEPIDVERFRLSTATLDSPAYFQIVFYLGDRRYRYGFEVDEYRVCSEWLYHARQRETRLFVREGQQFDLSGAFKEGWGLEKRTRENALLLSVVAQFNGELAMALLGWFRSRLRIVSGLSDALYGPLTMERFEADEGFRRRVLAFVREADLAIESIDVERTAYGQDPVSLDLRGWMGRSPKSYPERMMLRETQPTIARVTTRHQVYDRDHSPAGWETFDLTVQESAGTQKIFYLCGPLMETLDEGRVLVIDEMEARLHPFITRAIIQLFHSSQTNPYNAQLIFCTHDTGLLDRRRFRRDQIWFTEKDRYGASDLYSLAELQVRNDASFDKDYIAGKYGAVPFVGGLQALFEEGSDGETA
jgi:hypothetical protein